ncbi:hypothetical protein [Rhodovulum adriaticum]|uniref:Uracil DNA glycosylase superfamily protein n=1 Tax=Rhodovulum adriaticum TaxID=35804 RepID=A0A4R2NVD2_RHOAD|nr:hypothetical protein [Rhodovulum adriaticum]TCP26059.1 hypothetical protein EV656_10220 [Rhodovulum adriaticum]
MTDLTFPLEHEIDQFALGFFGYGDLSAPLWFIGMEEGGGQNAKDVTKRIRVWQKRGSVALEDLAEYHDEVMEGGFKAIAKQNTWSALSRIQLAYDGNDTSSGAVRHHWRECLGRSGSATCIMELNPLPSPNIRTWNYPKFTSTPFLRSRISYNARYRAARIAKIRSLLEQASPQAVIFYGKKYEEFWGQIADVTFDSGNLHSRAVKGGTKFVSMHHPNARVAGKTTDYYIDLGRDLGVDYG